MRPIKPSEFQGDAFPLEAAFKKASAEARHGKITSLVPAHENGAALDWLLSLPKIREAMAKAAMMGGNIYDIDPHKHREVVAAQHVIPTLNPMPDSPGVQLAWLRDEQPHNN